MSSGRVRPRVLGWLAWVLTLLVALGLGLWLVGVVCNDRWLWSQLLWWMPGWIALPAGALVLALAGLCARAGEASRARGRVALACWAVTLGALVLCAVGPWRLPQLLTRDAAPARPPEGQLRVLHWNPTIFPRFEQFASTLLPAQADVVLITNPSLFNDLSDLAAGMASQLAAAHAAPGRTASSARGEKLLAISKHRVLAWGWAQLGITGSTPRTFTWAGGGQTIIDRGEALVLELDTTERWGTTTVVWFIDLPSDLHIPRERMLREAGEVLATFAGPIFERTPEGLDVPAGEATRQRLRRPDMVVGDMNTTRGSRSLRWLSEAAVRGGGTELTQAHAQAGAGLGLSYPRSPALVAIDHVLLARGLRASDYRIVDLGLGTHRAQVVDVERALPDTGGATGG